MSRVRRPGAPCGRPLFCLLTLLGGVAACAPGEAPSDGGAGEAASATTSGDVGAEGLLAADRAFAADVARRGLDAWVEWFAADGVMVVPGGLIEGREEIRKAMEPLFADSTLRFTWEPERAEAAAGGRMGYTVGRYLRRRAGTEQGTVESRGRYITVWRRDAEGAWKVALDTGIPDPE